MCPRKSLQHDADSSQESTNLAEEVLSDAFDSQRPEMCPQTLRLTLPATTKQWGCKQSHQTIQGNERLVETALIFIPEKCFLKPWENEVALFASTIYKTCVHDEIRVYELTTVKCLIVRSAGANLVEWSSNHLTWTLRIRQRNILKLICARK